MYGWRIPPPKRPSKNKDAFARERKKKVASLIAEGLMRWVGCDITPVEDLKRLCQADPDPDPELGAHVDPDGSFTMGPDPMIITF